MKRMALWILPLLVAVSSIASLAQSTNAGDIRGTVTDSSGAVIPGVTITVTNVDTGVHKDLVTNDSGIYDTDSIETGTYRLEFRKEGFQKLLRGPVTVQVGFTTVNGQMNVGSAAEQVTVEDRKSVV